MDEVTVPQAVEEEGAVAVAEAPVAEEPTTPDAAPEVAAESVEEPAPT